MKKQEIKVQFDENVFIANDEQFEVIKKLLHVKMSTKELIAIRDILVSAHKRAFNSKKIMKNIYSYHYNKSNIKKGEISYEHLLMAELIFNFVIASKDEYLLKCDEFNIKPYDFSK